MRVSDRTVRVAIVAQLVTGIVAVVAMVLAIELSALERQHAARDSCELLVGLVEHATGPTSPARARANAYVASTPLADCHRYAARVGGLWLP